MSTQGRPPHRQSTTWSTKSKMVVFKYSTVSSSCICSKCFILYFLADLFNQTQSQILWETFSHAKINPWSIVVHKYHHCLQPGTHTEYYTYRALHRHNITRAEHYTEHTQAEHYSQSTTSTEHYTGRASHRQNTTQVEDYTNKTPQDRALHRELHGQSTTSSEYYTVHTQDITHACLDMVNERYITDKTVYLY